MKYAKVIIFLMAGILIFLIYKLTYKPRIDYLALGDGLVLGITPFGEKSDSYTDYFNKYIESQTSISSYNKSFAMEDYRITDLIKDIKENKSIKKDDKTIYINQAIKRSELITISIGSEELFYKLKVDNLSNIQKIYKYIDEIFIDYEELLILIREKSNKPIILIGFYNPIITNDDQELTKIKSIFNYIDIKFNDLIDDNIYYIDIYHEFSKKTYYMPNQEITFPSLEGYNYISNRLIEFTRQNKLIS